jgi:hypothetical protein
MWWCVCCVRCVLCVLCVLCAMCVLCAVRDGVHVVLCVLWWKVKKLQQVFSL